VIGNFNIITNAGKVERLTDYAGCPTNNFVEQLIDIFDFCGSGHLGFLTLSQR
jgi:hypothetical protein